MSRAFIIKNIEEFRLINTKFLNLYYNEDNMSDILERSLERGGGIIVYDWPKPEFNFVDTTKELDYNNNLILNDEIIVVEDMFIKNIRKKKIQRINDNIPN